MRRTIISLAIVLAAYGGYALVAARWIDPSAQVQAGQELGAMADDAPSPTAIYQPLLSLWFSEQDWELENAAVLKTHQAMLLIRNHQPLEKRQLRVWPCTMILHPQGLDIASAQKSPPMILRAPEGAIIEFDADSDLQRGQLGKIVSARFQGQVSLRRQESSAGAADQIELSTSGIQMSADRLWSPNDVHFRFGNSFGSGRDLTIRFRQPDSQVIVAGRDTRAELQSLELVRVDRLYLDVDDGKTKANRTPPTSDRPPPWEITARGPFYLDFLRHLATLEDHVDIRRVHPQGQSDQLSCERVTLFFDGDAEVNRDDTSELAARGPSIPKLQLQRVVALGNPAVLNAPTWDLQVRCERVEYDVLHERIAIESSQGVFLRHANQSFDGKRIEYQAGAPGTLGTVVANGPGSLAIDTDEDADRPMQVTWQQHMQMLPETEGHRISIVGGAEINGLATGQMLANAIHVWFRQRASSTDSRTDASGHWDVVGQFRDFEPDRLLAEDDVRFDSPRLSGQVQRLEMWFDHELATNSAAGAATDGASGQMRLSAPLLSGQQRGNGASREHFDLRGETLRVLLTGHGADYVPREVTVSGQVACRRDADASSASADSLLMSGDLLKMQSTTAGALSAEISGAPASIELGRMAVNSDAIRWEAATNRVTIPGPGKARVPLPGDDRKNPQLADVIWQSQLLFDGQTMTAGGGVSVTSQTQNIRMRQLRIELQRSNGIGVSPPGTPTVVKSLLAEGDVLVENRIHDQQGLVAIDRLSVPWLRVEQESGTVTAGGPGWYSTVRADELPMGEIDMQRGLGAVRIEFAGGIAGNLHHREVSFQRAVHAVYGMVTGWDESLRFDDPQPPPGTVLLQCQRLTALAMGRGAGASTAPQRSTLPLGPTVSVGKANVELIAEGNTEVRSDRYAARAHRISYAQSKDLLILEGDGRTDAHIWYNASGSSWQSHAAAQKMKYWRAQNRVNVESGAAIDLLNTARSR